MPNIPRQIVSACSEHLTILLLKACFQPQNGHSKTQERYKLFDLSHFVIYLAWSDPTSGTSLSNLSRKKREEEERYRIFVETVDPKQLENPEKDLTGGIILGSGGFVKWVKETFVDPREDDKEIPHLTFLKRTIKIETIIDTVGSEFGCTREKILEKGRKGNLARDISVYLARDLSGESAQSLGAYFGGISGAGITMRYKRVFERASRSRRLKGRVKKIRSQIVNI